MKDEPGFPLGSAIPLVTNFLFEFPYLQEKKEVLILARSLKD